MPARTVRRRKHKQIARAAAPMTAEERRAEATRLLLAWRGEAFRRAEFLNLPRVWKLATDPEILALVRRLDPGGGMLRDLRSFCAAAINRVAGLSKAPVESAEVNRLTSDSASVGREGPSRAAPGKAGPGRGRERLFPGP